MVRTVRNWARAARRRWSRSDFDRNNQCIDCGEHIADPHGMDCERRKTAPEARWRDNRIQFARLLAEMDAAGFFDLEDERTDGLFADLCESMGLDVEDVRELIDRANTEWDGQLRRIAARRARRRSWRRAIVAAVVVAAIQIGGLAAGGYTLACVQEDSTRARAGDLGQIGCVWWGPVQGSNPGGDIVWNRPGGDR